MEGRRGGGNEDSLDGKMGLGTESEAKVRVFGSVSHTLPLDLSSGSHSKTLT